MKDITLCITSFNRPDLLDRTINSAIWYGDELFDDIIIIEDSGNKAMIEYLNDNYSWLHLILHEQTKGAYESIDEAYSHIKTPYVFHCEDDWEFYKGGFIEPAIKVLECNPKIMQVNLSNEENIQIETKKHSIFGVEFGIMGDDINGWWHGFTCRPAIRSMAAYNEVKPWTQWAVGADLSIKECMVGQKYYELGYKAAVLNEYFCKHTGGGRCTWHENI